jgi:hypothetical protein
MKTKHLQDTGRPELAGLFEPFLRRIEVDPTSGSALVMAAFAVAILDGVDFNLGRIERLPDESDQALCVGLFEYCLSVGLSEEDRLAASAALKPFSEMSAPGARH